MVTYYCSPTDIRTISGLSTTDISDDNLNSIMALVAVPQLNHDINIKVVREKIEYIDNTRQNKVDGSNATYYVRHWEKYYIGDLDDDGDVDTSDVTVYLVDSDGTETTATVSTIAADSGRFVLSSAPAANKEVYVTYCYCPISQSTPSPLLKPALALLTSAWAFTKIDVKKLQSYSIGKLRIAKQSQGFSVFYDKYRDIVNQIKSSPFKKSEAPSIYDVVIPGF